jgi:hypothetical protein
MACRYAASETKNDFLTTSDVRIFPELLMWSNRLQSKGYVEGLAKFRGYLPRMWAFDGARPYDRKAWRTARIARLRLPILP